MLRNQFKSKREQGFTIIEVLIVLAIAGLIIAIVLIAVPQLQRNQRDSTRKSILSRIKTELESYAANNNGDYPAANVASGASNLGTPSTAAGFFIRYLGCSGGTCSVNITDPTANTPIGTTTSTTGDPGATAGNMSYQTTRICSGETTAAGSSARQYAVQVRLESGAMYCLDNR